MSKKTLKLEIVTNNISNRNGRALEFKIIEYLLSSDSSFEVSLTERAKDAQKRDLQNFNSLPGGLQKSFIRCAAIVCNWLKGIVGSRQIKVDRLSDDDAKRGDVTDIRIISKDIVVNLSVKHNHSAVKHQRPATTANRCGYSKGSPEDVEFRKNLSEVIERFELKARGLVPNVKEFNELDRVEDKFIENNLYKPVCKLVCDAINELCCNSGSVQQLFLFLVGNCSFYKIIDSEDCVKILNFNKIALPGSLQARLKGNSYVLLIFDNRWEISMRIHTASSRVGNSLKFDSQPIKMSGVEEIVVRK